MTSPIGSIGGAVPVGQSLTSMGVPSTNALDPASGGIGSLGVAGAQAGAGAGGTSATTGTPAVPGASGVDFAAHLGSGVDALQGLQSTSDKMAIKAATGNLSDVHDYMIASNEAGLATQMTVAVRNKALQAFTQIMQMQV